MQHHSISLRCGSGTVTRLILTSELPQTCKPWGAMRLVRRCLNLLGRTKAKCRCLSSCFAECFLLSTALTSFVRQRLDLQWVQVGQQTGHFIQSRLSMESRLKFFMVGEA